METQNTSLEEQNVDYDAELLKEAIAEDEEKTPSTNVQKDYEQSKKFSTPSQEREPEEVSPSIGSSFNSENKQSDSSAEGNPESFRAMAQEVSPQSDE
jgi:hypothetical protein